MALDRESIQKRDFPTARQGYDKAAVDAHLAAIADELEHATLASSASERVRTIVEAAETSAAQIQREADEAARATRQEAEQAARHAREGAGRVSDLTTALAAQLETSRRQLESLLESLTPATTGAAGHPGPQPQTPTTVPPATATEPALEATGAAEPEPVPEAHATSGPQAAPSGDVPSASPAEDAEQLEGARLIALNMALNGSSRDETAKYLEENFQLADRDRLLDEVYASVEG